jgi:hypothetical protein
MYNPTITLSELQATIGFEHATLCQAYQHCTSEEIAETIFEALCISHSKVLKICLDTFFLPEEQKVLEAYVNAIGHYEDASEFISCEAGFSLTEPSLGGIFEMVGYFHEVIEDFIFNDFKVEF